MHLYGFSFYYSPRNCALLRIWGTITMGIFTLLRSRVQSTNTGTLPTKPSFGSTLGSVPQKYCINRVTVKCILGMIYYVCVKCLRCTIFILYVVMMVFSIIRAWLPWQKHPVAWKIMLNRLFCREYEHHKVGQSTVSEDFSTPCRIFKKNEMTTCKTYLKKKKIHLFRLSLGPLKVKNKKFTWFLAVEPDLVQIYTYTVFHRH